MSVLDIKIKQQFDPTGKKGGYSCDLKADEKSPDSLTFDGLLDEMFVRDILEGATPSQINVIGIQTPKKMDYAAEVSKVKEVYDFEPFEKLPGDDPHVQRGGIVLYDDHGCQIHDFPRAEVTPDLEYTKSTLAGMALKGMPELRDKVISEMTAVNKLFENLPFDPIEGGKLSYSGKTNDELCHEHWLQAAFRLNLGEFGQLVPVSVSRLWEMVKEAKTKRLSDTSRMINTQAYYPLSLYRVEFGRVANITMNIQVPDADAFKRGAPDEIELPRKIRKGMAFTQAHRNFDVWVEPIRCSFEDAAKAFTRFDKVVESYGFRTGRTRSVSLGEWVDGGKAVGRQEGKVSQLLHHYSGEVDSEGNKD